MRGFDGFDTKIYGSFEMWQHCRGGSSIDAQFYNIAKIVFQAKSCSQIQAARPNSTSSFVHKLTKSQSAAKQNSFFRNAQSDYIAKKCFCKQ